ncbi:MAG: hypothetical protein WAX69_02875 [Victivallales bacterium]
MKRSIILTVSLIFLIALFLYFFIGKKAFANKALGGPVKIEFLGMKPDNNITTNRTVELNYDLKKTIDNARSIKWSCKCQCKDSLVINGEYYTIFKDCRSQDGCQLIRRGDNYYLIKKKLSIIEKQEVP